VTPVKLLFVPCETKSAQLVLFLILKYLYCLASKILPKRFVIRYKAIFGIAKKNTTMAIPLLFENLRDLYFLRNSGLFLGTLKYEL
jgi:hypothetical protein